MVGEERPGLGSRFPLERDGRPDFKASAPLHGGPLRLSEDSLAESRCNFHKFRDFLIEIQILNIWTQSKRGKWRRDTAVLFIA